jgi:hypothetical protein
VPAGGITTQKVKLAGYTNFGAGNTGHVVYHGSIVAQDVSDTDGYSRAVGFTPASGDVFMGVALEKQIVDSSTLADGSVEVTVAKNGTWGFPKGSLAQTDVGADIYCTDDNVVQSSSSNALKIGKLEDVDALYAWVNIAPYFGTAT